MPSIRGIRLKSRVFAVPAAVWTAAVAAGIVAVALVAGAVRVLPLVLAPSVPLRLAPILARGIAGVALETALFVAPSIAWAIAASRLVDRGEARALFAAGASPMRIVATGWPAALGIGVCTAIAAMAWGREAAAPGRVMRNLIEEARVACAAAPRPAAVDVPLIGVSWVCVGDGPPRAIAAAPLGRGALSAAAMTVSDDLRALDAADLTLVLPAEGDRGEAQLHAAIANVHGLAPIGRASNLTPAVRAAILAMSAIALAAVAGGAALVASIRNRAAALALGAVGPIVALLVFSALERAPSPTAAYAAVPAAGLAAAIVAGAFGARGSRGGTRRRVRR